MTCIHCGDTGYVTIWGTLDRDGYTDTEYDDPCVCRVGQAERQAATHNPWLHLAAIGLDLLVGAPLRYVLRRLPAW